MTDNPSKFSGLGFVGFANLFSAVLGGLFWLIIAPLLTVDVFGKINYDMARDRYSKNVFIISLVAGVITFIVGFFVLSIEPVGSALIGSGIWAIFYGTVWNWRNFGNVWRFLLLLVVLIVLIWLAVRLNRKRKGGFWFRLGIGKG